MFRARWRSWRFWAVAPLAALTGCQGLLGPSGPPQDPLFLSHRPMEGRATQAAPVVLAAVEPSTPTLPAPLIDRPALAYWRTPRPLDGPGDGPRLTPGILTNRPAPP